MKIMLPKPIKISHWKKEDHAIVMAVFAMSIINLSIVMLTIQ